MKAVIIGKAHNGTCSLERYLVEQGHEVIREEQAINRYTNPQLLEKYPDSHFFFIHSTKKTPEHIFQQINKRLKGLPVTVLELESMALVTGFPWENKGNHYSNEGIRPDYSKYAPKEKT